MNRVISNPTWGASLLEDTETGEFSFQCLCGGVGMYWQRVILSHDEAEQIRIDPASADQMVSDVCKRSPHLVARLVDALDPTTI